jgi:hypothetical protein
VGVDGQDGEDYAVNLMGNLQSLLEGVWKLRPSRQDS